MARLSELPVDVVPEGEFPEIIISTSCPGASPVSIQSLITSPIESVSVTVPGVHKVTSTSQPGTSNVTVQFVESANLDLARFELADRLSLLHDELPPGIPLPTLRANLPRQFRELVQKMRELNQRGSLKDFHDRVYKIRLPADGAGA